MLEFKFDTQLLIEGEGLDEDEIYAIHSCKFKIEASQFHKASEK